MRATMTAGLVLLGAAVMPALADADDRFYGNFPITVKGYQGPAKHSVSYGGQIARQVLHDSLKALAAQGKGSPDPRLKADMLAYYDGTAAGRAILAPKTKGPFVVLQTGVDDLSKKRNLAGITFKGAVTGMPNAMTGPELVKFWIDKASAANKGIDSLNGYNYAQLISKFLMGAGFYNQVVDKYLDENLAADVKPNDKPYDKGAPYTGKEHSWGEAFGYFGAPAHTLMLTPQDVYDINKQAASAISKADYNKDGKIDLYTEMTFGPAYYAAGFDASVYGRSNGTTYLHTITKAFLDGRKLLVAAKGETLTDAQRSQLRAYATTIETNWERVLAEATFKYAGEVYKDLGKLVTVLEAKGDPSKVLAGYITHWGELKGFSLALQSGRKNLGETAVVLNRLIGFGPVMANASRVVDIDRQGNYVKDQASGGLGEYKVHMLRVQKLMIDKFAVKARNHDSTAALGDMLKKMNSGSSAEND